MTNYTVHAMPSSAFFICTVTVVLSHYELINNQSSHSQHHSASDKDPTEENGNKSLSLLQSNFHTRALPRGFIHCENVSLCCGRGTSARLNRLSRRNCCCRWADVCLIILPGAPSPQCTLRFCRPTTRAHHASLSSPTAWK